MNEQAGAPRVVDLADKALYRYWTPVTMRFSDQDSMGHINNVSYAAYYESGRVAYGVDFIKAAGRTDIDFMIVMLSINYIEQMHYPGTVEVGSQVLKLGNKSMTIGHGIFVDGRAMSTAECVVVFIDSITRATIVIPDDVRALLTKDMP